MVDINGTLLIQIVNFLIFVAILGHFCYKPVIKVLDERKQHIKNDLDSAANNRADAEKLKESYEAQLRDAEVRAQEIVDKADLSCEIAAKIISKNMTPDANDRLIAESIAKLDAKKAGK